MGRSAGDFEKVELAGDLEADLRCVTEWGDRWLVNFNSSKTKLLSINRRIHPYLPDISINDKPLPESPSFRLLFNTFLEAAISAGANILKILPRLHQKRLDLCIGPKGFSQLRAFYTSTNQQSALVLSTAATYGQVHRLLL